MPLRAIFLLLKASSRMYNATSLASGDELAKNSQRSSQNYPSTATFKSTDPDTFMDQAASDYVLAV
jgi:hypothetical protein